MDRSRGRHGLPMWYGTANDDDGSKPMSINFLDVCEDYVVSVAENPLN